MLIELGHEGREDDIRALFLNVFSDSEGAEEGTAIASFVTDLMANTPQDDLLCFTLWQEHALLAGVFFSAMRYDTDQRRVFILSPMAVLSERQGEGLGRRLIAHGLTELRSRGVDVALTYGDPAFYGKLGFEPITTDMAPAPFPLSQPMGWLGQSLVGGTLEPLQGEAHCVEALRNPELW